MKPPATFAGRAYDAVNMIAEAIRKAGPGHRRPFVRAGRHLGAKADSVVLLMAKDGKFAPAH